MAKLYFLTSKTIKTTICLFLLTIYAFGCVNSVRILDEVTPENPLPAGAPEASDNTATDEPDEAPVVAPAASLPSGQFPAATAANPVAGDTVNPSANVANPVTNNAANVPPITTPGAANAGAGGAAAANANPDHTLSFFMHDILGGSHPSGRVVTGVVANTNANGLPFSKPNSQALPLDGGVPLNTINGVINNNNYPFLVGLNGSPTSTVLQNSGNNNVVDAGENQPFVTGNQLPAGLTLQQLMFGSITVVDNELTEGHELGASVIGRAQGFYLASSKDGSSHTLALTALFHGGENKHEIEDTISFFGVHRTATPVSHLVIIGGTGKYENAQGHATIETDLHHDNHQTTDGVETVTHFTVYFTP